MDVCNEVSSALIDYYRTFLRSFPGKAAAFPFTAASIMEIWLDLEANERIFFNGKMVRKVMPGDPGSEITGPGIAVRIIQMDSKTEQKLKDFIDRKLAEKQQSQPPKIA